jgi:hypothetical protein
LSKNSCPAPFRKIVVLHHLERERGWWDRASALEKGLEGREEFLVNFGVLTESNECFRYSFEGGNALATRFPPQTTV